MTTRVKGVKGFTLDGLHHVRHIIITSVGDGSTQVGYLEWCEVDLSLTNADADDGQAIP